MKTKIGLEAMLEYLEIYLSTINAHNPDLKQAVDKALEMISVERLYKEVRGKEENKLIRESGNLEN